MAADEFMLELVRGSPSSILRLYAWSRPTLSLGRSQPIDLAADEEFCRRHGIDIVRRPTGGQAVLHDAELTYAVASSDPAIHSETSPYTAYRRISEALVKGFASLGIPTDLAPRGRRSATLRTDPCFLDPGYSEIICSGRKIAGSAQRHYRDRFLQHGSLLIRFDADLLAGATRSVAETLSGRVTSISEALGGDVPADLDRGFANAFSRTFGIEFIESPWSPEETPAIERRAIEGNSPISC